MNEQRTEAYLNLINQLLTCNEGDEAEILQENQELFDQGLIEVMTAVAQQFEGTGRENEAQWLINIAQQLTQILGLLEEETASSANTPQDYFNFLMETLQKVNEQKVNENDNPQVIYSFWAQNLDKLDDNLIRILNGWAKKNLSPFETGRVYGIVTNQAYVIVSVIVDFSSLIAQFPLGNIAINIEIAITGYEIALNILTFEVVTQDWASLLPEAWASVQKKLGIAYFKRIRGDKAENLELAISAYKEALKVFTFDAFSKDWSSILLFLAFAYFERIRGDKAENLELVISSCKEVLKMLTFDAFPLTWASTQQLLSVAYFKRIRGDKSENLELAIAACKQALKVWTIDAFPKGWATTQTNLSAYYRNRIKGVKAENLEMAIAACTEALNALTVDAFPEEWAKAQNNFGLAYTERIRGDKAENLELAITVYKKVLNVISIDAFSQLWAMTQNNLALAYFDLAYSYRIRGDKAENLENAIAACKEALKVLTIDAFPEDWATTQNNLAGVYSNRIRGDKAENLELAITACKEALKVRTFEAFPQDWALTQNNLATAYSERIRGEKAENLERAITNYNEALKVFTSDAFPNTCLRTARNLADLHYDEKQWKLATEAYNTAIEAVENARLEALNPQSRQEVLSNAIDVFHRIVQAHLNLNQPEKALEYIERSKGRNLVELMTQKNLHPQGVSQESIAQLNELKQRVVNERIRLQHQSINQNRMRSDNLNPYVQDQSHLKEYQQDLDNFIAREIKDPLFSLTQKVEPIPFTEIQALTDAETCLLQWYITREKILAFVVSVDGGIKVWQSSENDKNQLFDTSNNYRQLYYSKNGKQEWRNQLSNLLQTFADTLHINDILALIPDTCKRLIIIPHLFLHILPLHALPISNSHFLKRGWEGAELHDLFPNGVQYAPSCQLLKIAQSFHHTDFNKLFAIQNPTKDLLFTDLEVNILSTFFTESQIIAKDNATKNTILPHLKSSDNQCHHFSCHGSFNPANPLESALFLANQEPLTLGEIFELRLNQCRLVTLSACETGLIDFSISDEYIGLPSGFLFAGSPSVVSSLWTVNDLSTSFLMIKFYEILFNPNLNISVAVALKQAQNWLQNLTIKEAEKNLESQTFQRALIRLQQTLSSGDLFELEDAIALLQTKWKTMSPEDKPFNNPFYWAGFVASGV